MRTASNLFFNRRYSTSLGFGKVNPAFFGGVFLLYKKVFPPKEEYFKPKLKHQEIIADTRPGFIKDGILTPADKRFEAKGLYLFHQQSVYNNITQFLSTLKNRHSPVLQY